MTYNVMVSEAGKGRFHAKCLETGGEVISPNAEHDICHVLTVQGYQDGPVQFWRGGTKSLSHSSIHVMGRYRIKLGDEFPQRAKRRDGPGIGRIDRRGSSGGPETAGSEGQPQ